MGERGEYLHTIITDSVSKVSGIVDSYLASTKDVALSVSVASEIFNGLTRVYIFLLMQR